MSGGGLLSVSHTDVGGLLSFGASFLSKSDRPRHEARMLLAGVLGVSPEQVFAHPDWGVLPPACALFDLWLQRRRSGEPIAKIMEKKAFWKFDFKTTERTLDPRPDSEVLIEAVLGQCPSRQAPYCILELGVGTGCLILSLLRELPNANGIAVDNSNHALDVCQENARNLGVEKRCHWVLGHWFDSFSGSFDVILSNPPYIPSQDIEGLSPDVRLFDPRGALDGGVDGLDPYRYFSTHGIHRLMAKGGLLALEVGKDQCEVVKQIFSSQNLKFVSSFKDLQEIDRVLLWRKM